MNPTHLRYLPTYLRPPKKNLYFSMLCTYLRSEQLAKSHLTSAPNSHKAEISLPQKKKKPREKICTLTYHTYIGRYIHSLPTTTTPRKKENMSARKSLADQIAELEDPAPKGMLAFLVLVAVWEGRLDELG